MFPSYKFIERSLSRFFEILRTDEISGDFTMMQSRRRKGSRREGIAIYCGRSNGGVKSSFHRSTTRDRTIFPYCLASREMAPPPGSCWTNGDDISRIRWLTSHFATICSTISFLHFFLSFSLFFFFFFVRCLFSEKVFSFPTIARYIRACRI